MEVTDTYNLTPPLGRGTQLWPVFAIRYHLTKRAGFPSKTMQGRGFIGVGLPVDGVRAAVGASENTETLYDDGRDP